MAEAPQAQVSPQEGVSEPLLPDGPAQDARCIPWGCRSVSPSFMCSLSRPANLFTAPSLALGAEPVSAHCEAELPFYRRGNRLRHSAGPDLCLAERNHEAPCLPWRPSPCACWPSRSSHGLGGGRACCLGQSRSPGGRRKGGGCQERVGHQRGAAGRTSIGGHWGQLEKVAGWVKEDYKCQPEPSP